MSAVNSNKKDNLALSTGRHNEEKDNQQSHHCWSTNTIDLEIFDSKTTACDAMDDCPCRVRLAYSQKYYQSLDIINGSKDISKLGKFVRETYQGFLDDYIHVTTKHNNQKDLHQTLSLPRKIGTSCDLESCSAFKRHSHSRSNIKYKMQNHLTEEH